MKIRKASGMDIKTLLRIGKHLLVKSLRGSRILVKDPIALLSAGWLYETYDFKVIVMIRNPFAFVGSLKMAGWTFCFENLRKQEGLMQAWLNQFADCFERNPKEAASNDYQPRDSRSSLNTWKERLSDDEIERVKVATHDIASHFYEKIIESGR